MYHNKVTFTWKHAKNQVAAAQNKGVHKYDWMDGKSNINIWSDKKLK